MITNNLIEKYKNYRKQSYLNSPSNYKSKFAFIGVGNHSTNNLYPCLDYLSIPLKYICTKSEENAAKMAMRYKDATGTNNIEEILNDDEVKGVFICSNPATHFELTQKVLSSKKSVFVEKPPCLTLAELEELKRIEKNDKQICLVGLQKRYAAVYAILKKRLKDMGSYNFRYVTGSYPEGDAILDLFIHPIDILIYLFGAIKTYNINVVKKNKNLTLFLVLNHKNGATGSVELSTDYTWDSATEHLIVTTPKGFFETVDLNKLTFTSKPPSVMGLPLEKVLSFNQKKEVLFSSSGFIPIGKYNQIVTQGYFDEIKIFVDAVEGKQRNIITSLDDVTPAYKLIEDIKREMATG